VEEKCGGDNMAKTFLTGWVCNKIAHVLFGIAPNKGCAIRLTNDRFTGI